MTREFFILFITIFLPYHFLSAQEPYYPLRIVDPITLNGKLDEPVWMLTPLEDDFMQTDPSPGAAPTERTEVRILYNDEHLYVGIRAFDSDPSGLIRLRLERDFEIGEDDETAFIIDTYNDKFSGMNFMTNTLNARWDAQVLHDGIGLNDSYNTFWDVATHVDSTGYVTEYRIPFSSLRFESKPIVTMGFRVARLIKRKNELLTFPRCDPATEEAWTNVSFAREIVFFNLKSRKPFYIIPYVIGNYSEENVLNEDGTAYEKQTEFLVRKHFVDNETLDKILSNIGADVKYGLSKNFTLDLTLNTDFAQAEVDDRIINLSKYEVNLPEKRTFFLESANNLSFGFPSGNEIFISRSIGNENGVIVPIIAGARMTGKSHGWQLGILNMQTKKIEADSIAPHNFFVFRTRKDIDSLGSFAGGIFTNRINTDSSHLSNQSLGIDFVKRVTQKLTIEGGLAASLIDADFDPIGKSMYYHAGIFRSANEGLSLSSTIDFVGREFDPVMGYLDDNNYGAVTIAPDYSFYAGDESAVEYWFADSYNEYRWKLSSGLRETFSTELFSGVAFKSGAYIAVSPFEYTNDSLTEDWHLDDNNAIAQGTYKMFNNTIELLSPQKSTYSAFLVTSYGGFYGGTRFFISPDIRYSFNKNFSAGITYEYNHITFSKYLDTDVSTLYETNLIRLSLALLLSTRFSIKLYSQYDDLSHSISSNLRIRYNPREGTDLFIVINQGLNTDRARLDPHLPIVDAQEVTIKFIKTFAL